MFDQHCVDILSDCDIDPSLVCTITTSVP